MNSKWLKYLNENLSDTTNFTNDLQILRFAIQAELDAINLYEQLAEKAFDPVIKDILLDVAYEEKVHVEEFEELLEELDEEMEDAEEEAEKEWESKYEY